MGTAFSRTYGFGERMIQLTLTLVTYPVVLPLSTVLGDKGLWILKYILKGPSTKVFTFSIPSSGGGEEEQ